jgi:hypothetical protein
VPSAGGIPGGGMKTHESYLLHLMLAGWAGTSSAGTGLGGTTAAVAGGVAGFAAGAGVAAEAVVAAGAAAGAGVVWF